ncbi:DUF5060 domain-containing protein, partial [bacterium]|nr:DUF5060 domain-containing protein [bacterium]
MLARQRKNSIVFLLVFFLHVAISMHSLCDESYAIKGELKTWYPLTIDFTGPKSSETANNPNPFLDYRLQVEFTGPSGRHYNVPGFFAGDGQGGGSGDVWRVRFSPDAAGEWSFQASFRQGKRIAVSLQPNEGKCTAFDGCKGHFTVAGRDK